MKKPINKQPAKKKQFGQHFLRDHKPIDSMLNTVPIDKATTVVEIGCGDGVLTRAIIHQTPCKALRVFEIDPEWAGVVQEQVSDERLQINITDVMDIDLADELKDAERVVMLANLPYQITFPLFEKLARYGDLFKHGIVMVQEEAAQRMAATSGRRYGSISLFLQHYFTFTLRDKVPASSFSPPPKVESRLIEFVPRTDQGPIKNEAKFWKFVRACFITPRQTLRNNLKRSGYAWQKLSDETLGMRAQQLQLPHFLSMWQTINS